MIKDKLENINRYSINENFELFKAFLKASNGKGFEDISMPLKAIPLEYATKEFDLSKFENHQRVIDIHFLVKGQEQIGLNSVDQLTPNMEYDQEKDYQLFDGEVKEVINVDEGEFLLLFPGEAHVTGGGVEQPMQVSKIVFKIPL
jgi:biofilm protein TabA